MNVPSRLEAGLRRWEAAEFAPWHVTPRDKGRRRLQLIISARTVSADGLAAETALPDQVITVRVRDARTGDDARRVARTIANSPLVKTAVHGADPNWGRVAMAIGKCSDDTDIDQERVVIRFGTTEVYPNRAGDAGLTALSEYLGGDEVAIRAHLGIAAGRATVWGCDLTDGYIRINADYTT